MKIDIGENLAILLALTVLCATIVVIVMVVFGG